MGSSGGSGTFPAPRGHAPPANMIKGQGENVDFNPQYVNYLPDDPTAMATGLTPEMVAQIMGTRHGGDAAPPGANGGAVAGGGVGASSDPQVQIDQLRHALSRQMLGGNPGGNPLGQNPLMRELSFMAGEGGLHPDYLPSWEGADVEARGTAPWILNNKAKAGAGAAAPGAAMRDRGDGGYQ